MNLKKRQRTLRHAVQAAMSLQVKVIDDNPRFSEIFDFNLFLPKLTMPGFVTRHLSYFLCGLKLRTWQTFLTEIDYQVAIFVRTLNDFERLVRGGNYE